MLTECMDFLCFEPCETDKMSWNLLKKTQSWNLFFSAGTPAICQDGLVVFVDVTYPPEVHIQRMQIHSISFLRMERQVCHMDSLQTESYQMTVWNYYWCSSIATWTHCRQRAIRWPCGTTTDAVVLPRGLIADRELSDDCVELLLMQ